MRRFFNCSLQPLADGVIQADSRKQAAERWKIVQDLRTKIFAETQDVTVQKAKVADKAFSLFDSYLRA